MKNAILQERPVLRRMIRYAEILVVTVLAVIAALTYRELKNLRAAPVILPAYWFNVATAADQTQRVHARGSWVSKDASPEFLHTTTIECVKTKMQCMESSATVSVKEGGFLETVQTLFDVESWTDTEILTKMDVQPCASRILMLDIANKQAKSVVKGNPTVKSCKTQADTEQTFKLVAGQQAHAEAVKKGKSF